VGGNPVEDVFEAYKESQNNEIGAEVQKHMHV